MKSVRLLPVVIFAALALLLFKGIGLIANGGYVLTGPNAVLAAGAEDDPTLANSSASEVTITDRNPTLGDTAPTMATRAEGFGARADSAEPPSASVPSESSSVAASGEESSAEAAEVACPLFVPPAIEAGAAPKANDDPAMADCTPSAFPVNEHGDALPMVLDSSGQYVPLDVIEGDDSTEALLARLTERRVELDKREAEIAMRTTLLEAAEKRLNERTSELAALEAQVATLVDEKQAAEEAGFKAIVSMYETMKPKDAARIFDTLNTTILVKVVRSMSPRKMAPILAEMSPEPAQQLTIALAATENTDVVVASGENLAALPQIVGQ